MFLAKINYFLVCFILLHDLKVYHFQTAPIGKPFLIHIQSLINLKYSFKEGACPKTNGRMQSNLETRNDTEIRSGHDSYCLIESNQST